MFYTGALFANLYAPILVLAILICCAVGAAEDATLLTSDDIISQHDKVQDAPVRNYNNLKVLGFMTPWNRRGEHVSLGEAGRGRLDVVSPVTYQMTPSGLKGGHDFDSEYYTKINETGARLMPRVLFEPASWSLAALDSITSDIDAFAKPLIDECESRGFTGVVVELWQTLVAVGALTSDRATDTLILARKLGTTLRDAGLRTALVLPPYGRDVPQQSVTPDNLGTLAVGYTYFIVMTYDFSTPSSEPGPIAPIEWVQKVAEYLSTTCGLGEKVLLGLNFYGVDFVRGGDIPNQASRHLVRHELIDLLETHSPRLVWHDRFQEHFFMYSDGDVQHIVFYPSRHSIAKRLEVAESVGCGGIAIWDLGQGLDHFFEEF